MIRILLPAVAVALGIAAVTSAMAQPDVIKARQELMKRSGQQMGVVGRMMRGQDPFDAAKVNGAFDAWADKAQKLPAAFPDASRTGTTNALAKVWEDRAGFSAEIAKFQKDVADNRAKAAANVDGLKAAFPTILNDCNSCHEKFRKPLT
jgi:cytochrome c556